ncbi:MAG TPA: TetR family transcriptional regulator C-terminal domain-containing protein [Candidatus Stackebrandtia faecavium]|nr:TetR family transcriptional regulator C-terminal domain-containing protein [Candidatus Stackebrandtia faecavium]
MPREIDHNERRERIAEAAWRVILREGVGGASVRTVAAEAGQSVGSLRHVFYSQAQLLAFALDLVVARAQSRVERLPPVSHPVAGVIAVASELLPLDIERRAEMEVYLALFTAAHADPDLRPSRDRAHAAMRGGAAWMIDQLDNGTDLAPNCDRDLEARRLHAVIDGVASLLVAESADADPQWGLDVVVRHIRSLATGLRLARISYRHARAGAKRHGRSTIHVRNLLRDSRRRHH